MYYNKNKFTKKYYKPKIHFHSNFNKLNITINKSHVSSFEVNKKILIFTITMTNSNFFLSLKTPQNKTLRFYSAGILGFKNKRKNTNYTINYAYRLFLNDLKTKYPNYWLKIYAQGLLKPYHMNSLKILLAELKIPTYAVFIKTKFAHNGVKNKKIRRI